MGKPKAWKNADKAGKKQLHEVKGGSVKKNKDMKSKNTPTGKVVLVNKSKSQDKHTPFKKDAEVAKKSLCLDQKSTSNKAKQLKQDSPNKKKNFPSKKNRDLNQKVAFDSNAKQQKQDSLTKKSKTTFDGNAKHLKQDSLNRKPNLPNEKKQYGKRGFPTAEAMRKEDEFLTELRRLHTAACTSTMQPHEKVKYDVSSSDDEDDLNQTHSDDEDDSDTDVPDILGKTLEDQSDEDDEDYQEEDEDDDNSCEEEMVEHKGVKMFKGIRSNNKKNIDEKNQDKDDDESESDDTLRDIDSDEDDDEDEDEDEEEEDEDEEEDYCNNHKTQAWNIKNKVDSNAPLRETDEEDDEDEADDDSDDSEDTDDSDDSELEMNLQTLVGDSIADDDDDDDEYFNEEDEDEDDDISSEDEDDQENYNAKRKAPTIEKNENPGRSDRSGIFLGDLGEITKETEKKKAEMAKKIILIENISKDAPIERIMEMCSEFIEVCDGRVCMFQIKPLPEYFHNFHKHLKHNLTREKIYTSYPHLDTLAANVVFNTSQAADVAAKCLHGSKYFGCHLNVITAHESLEKPTKAIYFEYAKREKNDNFLWETFLPCGIITRLRHVRDLRTGMSKRYGYVSFETESAVNAALKLHGTLVRGYPITVRPFSHYTTYYDLYIRSKVPTDEEQETKRVIPHKAENKPSKKFKSNSGKSVASNIEDERNVKKQKEDKEKSPVFQGQKVELKNKKKNKFDKKKKKMAKKLTA